MEHKCDNCKVTCDYCKEQYSTIAHSDEVPVLCDYCYTPSLRVTEREPSDEEFANWE